MQLDIFNSPQINNWQKSNLEQASKVEGLKLYPDFINESLEKMLIECIDKQPWLKDLKRRVQHYGYKYDYRARRIDENLFLGPLPDWLQEVTHRLKLNKLISDLPDQAIVNEYQPGQGIAPHIDCQPCFGDTIISLSLGSACIISFERLPNIIHKVNILLEPKSLIMLTGPSRYEWYHSIPSRKTDEWNEQMLPRKRRVSITFRKVIKNMVLPTF